MQNISPKRNYSVAPISPLLPPTTKALCELYNENDCSNINDACSETTRNVSEAFELISSTRGTDKTAFLNDFFKCN